MSSSNTMETGRFLFLLVIISSGNVRLASAQLLGGLLGGNNGNNGGGLLGLGSASNLLGLQLKSLPFSVDMDKLESGLLEQLHNSPLDIIVYCGGIADSIREVESRQHSDIVAKREVFISSLQTNARTRQSSVKTLLSNLGIANFESFWVANCLTISDAGLNLVQALTMLPEVTNIKAARTITLSPIVSPFAPLLNIINAAKSVQSGVQQCKADQVWANYGIKGQGVTVANIDSGVNWQHEALINNFRSNKGWYDPYAKTNMPNDQNGHGSHVMGTICGQKGIGVAPEATWIACKGCSTSSCTSAALFGCGQWCLAPTDTNGFGADPSMSRDVVNNSWGSQFGGDDWYDPVLRAWQTAGITPVFAVGNSGPLCLTAGSPGGQEACPISVGATDANGAMARFSSKGPNLESLATKPEISARGTDVYSCSHSSNTGYATISGTSMASPHVAGVVALIKSANTFLARIRGTSATLGVDKITSVLFGTADTTKVSAGLVSCDNIFGLLGTDGKSNDYGYGQVDALSSVEAVIANL